MKNKIHLSTVVFIIALSSADLLAQDWIINGNINNFFVQPDNTVPQTNWIRSVGIGYFGTNFTNSFLHVDATNLLLPSNNSINTLGEVFRTNAPNTDANNVFWRMLHGGTEAFNINKTVGSNNVALGTVQAGDLNFFTFNNQRMTIKGTNNITNWGNNTGYVGIGNTQPLSLLHLGNVNCYNGLFCAVPNNTVPRAGWRPWMITGTFMCGVPGVTSSDHMYVGLKNENGLNDRDDAVIAWGDNLGTDGGAPGPDNFRFIFSEYCNEAGADPTASGLSGLEVMRLAPYIENGNFISINAGIGNYNNNPYIPPQRLLEVLDMAKDRPQFRITYTQNANLHNAIFTDFQTTQNGDLNIRGFSTGAPIANGKPGTSTNRGRTGFNLPLNTDPANTLEINSGITSVAGLRFTQLSGTPTLSAGNGNALTVDANGDVILVPAPAVCTTFTNGTITNFISKWSSNSPNSICDTKIFEDPSTFNVGIDWATSNTLDAKLKLIFTTSSATPTGIYARVSTGSGTGSTVGMLSVVLPGSGSSSFAGVKGVATGNSSTNNVYGLWGIANGTSSTQSTPRNFGVFGYATGGGPGSNIGVYGKVDAVGSGGGDWAGFFEGDVYTTGAYYPSDASIKDNVQPIVNAVAGILNLQPKTYTFNQDQNNGMNFPSGNQIGLIAEEVEAVYPELVRIVTIPGDKDSAGNEIGESLEIKGLNYTGLIPVLIAAFQEQNAAISSLAERVDELEMLLDDCCSQTHMRKSGSHEHSDDQQLSIELRSISAIILDQNSPNPFAEHTTISWFIPQEVQKAELIIFDGLGHVLKTLDINERGDGQLKVYASSLSSGTYSYSLIAGAKVIDTKKMVKQQ
jgi:hypothetical protein